MSVPISASASVLSDIGYLSPFQMRMRIDFEFFENPLIALTCAVFKYIMILVLLVEDFNFLFVICHDPFCYFTPLKFESMFDL